MKEISVDPAIADQLRSGRDEVLIVDREGDVLGVFRPINMPPYPEELIPPITQEELEKSFAEPRRYSTDEVLEHLKGA